MDRTLNERQERAIRIYESVRDATVAVLAENVKAEGTIPALDLLLGAAASVGATIDMIVMQTGGKMSRELALGVVMVQLVNGFEVELEVPDAEEPPQDPEGGQKLDG